jgi:hypothetical protein
METFANRTTSRNLRKKSREVRANAEAVRKKACDLNMIAEELMRERAKMIANLHPASSVVCIPRCCDFIR